VRVYCDAQHAIRADPSITSAARHRRKTTR